MAETATNPETIVMTDPEWIALESISEETRRFIFGEAMLRLLQGRGLAEPGDELWKVTPRASRRSKPAATDPQVQFHVKHVVLGASTVTWDDLVKGRVSRRLQAPAAQPISALRQFAHASGT